MDTRLSITIVAYHNYEDIRNAIKSIEYYTNKEMNKQIYVVDNSQLEKEDDEQLCMEFRNFLAEYNDVEYYKAESNLGFGKGHNYVLDKLQSEYHAIVNPDILLNEAALESILEYMDNNSDVGMCIPNVLDETGKRQLVYRKELTLFDMFIRMFCKGMFLKRQAEHTLQYEDYSKPFQVPFGQGSFLVIRTELFKELKGFDDNFFMYIEDADLCKRVNQVSKLMYFPGANVIHKWEKGSHKNMKLFKYHLKSMFYYFKKWGIKIV